MMNRKKRTLTPIFLKEINKFLFATMVMLLVAQLSLAQVSLTKNNDDDSMSLKVGGSEKAIIQTDGRMGVNLDGNKPTESLEVSGTVSATAFVGDGSGLTNLTGGSNISNADTSVSIVDSGTGEIHMDVDGDRLVTVDAAALHISGTNTISTSGTELILQQTGDDFGISRMTLANRDGLNGALFKTTGLYDLVDFAFEADNGKRISLRSEFRTSGAGSVRNSANNTYGEMQVLRRDGVDHRAAFFGFGASGILSPLFGVNTTSPQEELDVNGDILADSIRLDGTGSTGVAVDVSGTVSATAFVGDGSGLTGVGGANALNDLSDGYYSSVNKSVALGVNAMSETAVNDPDNIDVYGSVAIGESALHQVTTDGNFNTAVGYNSGSSLGSGASNVAIGGDALSGTTGYGSTGNVVVGSSAMSGNANGTYNVVVGADAGDGLNNAVSNVLMGYSAATNLGTGLYNIILGNNAADNLTAGSNNIVIGATSVANATGSNQLNIGDFIKASNMGMTGGATFEISDVMVFAHGVDSFSIGAGIDPMSIASADTLILLGNSAGGSAAGGENSVVLGGYAATNAFFLGQDVFIGANSGASYDEGEGNIIIGYNADVSYPNAMYELNIGNTLYGNLDQKKIGVGVVSPTESLEVSGTVSATVFVGDGSQLTGIDTPWSVSGSNVYRSSGNVGIGTSDPTFPFHLKHSESSIDSQMLYTPHGLTQATYYDLSGSGEPRFSFVKARGDISSPTAVLSNDILGQYMFSGYDGSSFIQSAIISAVARSNYSGGLGSADILFSTRDDDGLAERMRLTQSGFLGIGTNAPAVSLDVSGTLMISNGGEVCDDSTEGAIRYTTAGGVMYCNSISWGAMGGGLWTNNTDYINYEGVRVYKAGTTWDHSFGDAGMFYHEDKAALRLGTQNNGSADEANVGTYSVGIGNAVIASGDRSFALGSTSTASGTGSFAVGNGSQATGTRAIAMGDGARALNSDAIAIGSGAYASNLFSVAIGRNASSGQNSSFAAGNGARAAGVTAVSLGMGTQALNNYSLATNYQTVANGSSSVAMGKGSQANGITSFAFGDGVIAQGNNSIVFGLNNDISGTTVTDPRTMAIIGGEVGIGLTSPSVELDVSGSIQYTGDLLDASDRRLKQNIQPLEMGELERINQVKPVSFEMKDRPGATELGVIAQDFENIYPELVKTADDEMGTKSVNYIGMIAPMVKAMQELKAEVDALKAQNAEQARLIEELQAK